MTIAGSGVNLTVDAELPRVTVNLSVCEVVSSIADAVVVPFSINVLVVKLVVPHTASAWLDGPIIKKPPAFCELVTPPASARRTSPVTDQGFAKLLTASTPLSSKRAVP